MRRDSEMMLRSGGLFLGSAIARNITLAPRPCDTQVNRVTANGPFMVEHTAAESRIRIPAVITCRIMVELLVGFSQDLLAAGELFHARDGVNGPEASRTSPNRRHNMRPARYQKG